MTHCTDRQSNPAARRCARALLVLAAGTLVEAAGASQVTGGGIGKVANGATPATLPAPAPTSSASAASKRPAPAPRSAAPAGSAATR